MRSVPNIIRQREIRRAKEQRQPGARFILGCLTLLSLLITGLLLAAMLVYAGLTHDLPSLEIIPTRLDAARGERLPPTRLYDRSGERLLAELVEPAAIDWQLLTIDSQQANYLPGVLISATLASADPNFWSHPGFSLAELSPEAHPTLAQHLVYEQLLSEEPADLRRALRERLLAAQLTSHFGRQQVLAWYLNGVFYGRYNYGADAAARAYFGKPAMALTLAEAATLAASADAPQLNPHDAPEVARERQSNLLNLMVERGFITSSQANVARRQKLTFLNPVINGEQASPAFTSLVVKQLRQQYGTGRLERGGYSVITSLDASLQDQLTCAAHTHLDRLRGSFDETLTPNGEPCQAASLLPTFASKVSSGAQLSAQVVVIDPGSGELLAFAGAGSAVPGASLQGRPAGSLLTPLIYFTGFTQGLGPASLVWDIPATMPMALDSQTNPNPDGVYHGPQRVRQALTNDYLAPAYQLQNQFGEKTLMRTAQQLGLLESDLTGGLLSQNTRVTLMETSQVYGVFANQGLLAGYAPAAIDARTGLPPIQPVTVLNVQANNGKSFTRAGQLISRPVISADLAYLLTDVLSDESARWPSQGHPNPLEIGRPVAVKKGWTLDGTDAWTVGYTPHLVVGVWVGAEQIDDSSTTLPDQSASALWHAAIQYASRPLPASGWQAPAGVRYIQVCDPSGLLPSADCPNIVNEVFLSGNTPNQVDNLYQAFLVNRETGRLATVFTRPELVERRLYLRLPTEALDWAAQEGLEQPPEIYDVISAAAISNPDIQIKSPSLFATVRGKVPILGSAAGDGFQFFRLQAGQGLNPQTWLQIGQDNDSLVVADDLGLWDTQGLNGLYALQLVVVRQDQDVVRTTIQVTVDNIAPTVEILNPDPAQPQAYTPGEAITLLFGASDNLVIELLEIYMDGVRLASISQPPYAFPWKATAGEHTLRVVAVDRAGNTAETSLDFQVSP